MKTDRSPLSFRSITTCCYYKTAIYYPRTVAVSVNQSMLFSSGNSLRTLSVILSGEGLFEGTKRIAAVLFHSLLHRSAIINSKTFEFSLEGFAV